MISILLTIWLFFGFPGGEIINPVENQTTHSENNSYGKNITANIEIYDSLIVLKNKKDVTFTSESCMLEEKLTVRDFQVMEYFYSEFEDKFDYAIIVTNFEACQGVHQQPVRNEIKGIGLTPFDGGKIYGNTSRLKGVVGMGSPKGVALTTKYFFLHEFGHNWGVFIESELKNELNHWKDLANLGSCDVMSSGVIDFTFEDGIYKGYSCGGGENLGYSNLTLYLMGVVSKEAISNEKFYLMELQGTNYKIKKIYTINDIISNNGERIPDSSESQKEFNVAFILVTDGDGASPDEVEKMKSAMEDYKKWFSEATMERANVSFSLN